jgi:TrmH family RNA methyltransferase
MPDASPLSALSVVLVATRNPLNIGAAARAMSNFGFTSLRLVNPYEPSFREARSAVNAADVLCSAQLFNSLADAVADCSLVVGTTAARHRELQQPLHPLHHGAPLIQWHLQSGRVALLFGSEKTGLSNHDLSHCHWLLRIPTRDEHVSMNLGQAVAVCLYQIARELDQAASLSRQSANALPPELPASPQNFEAGTTQYPEPSTTQHPEPATAQDLERLTSLLLQSLQLSDYVKPATEASVEEKLRRLVRRLNLNPSDARLLLGMLRQISWKLRHPNADDPMPR